VSINGKVDDTRELLRMAAVQTAENTKQIDRFAKEFRHEMKETRAEHNREMKEIRALFKQMIKRIAV
jgi:hypothetical protein